jgi:hypothetical protein
MYDIVENYIKNVDNIMQKVKEHEAKGKFTFRGIGGKELHGTKYGESHFSSLFQRDMEQDLVDTIWETVPQEERKWCSQVVVNKYAPGDWLVKHQDSAGGYWKFKLVYLTQGKPHFKYWDKDGNEHLVQEQKGAMFNMPIETWHEVTKIEDGEEPKYSLCLIWE